MVKHFYKLLIHIEASVMQKNSLIWHLFVEPQITIFQCSRIFLYSSNFCRPTAYNSRDTAWATQTNMIKINWYWETANGYVTFPDHRNWSLYSHPSPCFTKKFGSKITFFSWSRNHYIKWHILLDESLLSSLKFEILYSFMHKRWYCTTILRNPLWQLCPFEKKMD